MDAGMEAAISVAKLRVTALNVAMFGRQQLP